MAVRLLAALIMIFLSGCAQQAEKEQVTYQPPATSKTELINRIKSGQQGLFGFAARASAEAHLIAENRKEKLSSVKAYFSDDNHILIKAGHTFGTAVVLGTNERNFWFSMDFGDIDEFYYGKNEKLASCGAAGLKTLPAKEAFGIIDTEGLEDAQLFFEENSYGLEVVGEDGKLQRSYIFSNRTNRLKEIDYYQDKAVALSVKFSDYQDFNGKTHLPREITIFSLSESIELKFSISRLAKISLSASQREKLYSMPAPDGNTKSYYLSDECEFKPGKPQ